MKYFVMLGTLYFMFTRSALLGQTDAVLELVEERKIYKLFKGFDKESRFEASGITATPEHFYIVFDNKDSIAKISSRKLEQSKYNRLIGKGAKGFEGITYNPYHNSFYLLVESEKQQGKHRGKIYEYTTEMKLLDHHVPDLVFKKANKGFEGIVYFQNDTREYLLLLCEGNRCKSGKKGTTPGYGRITVYEKKRGKFSYIETVKLPDTLHFTDYSGMDFKEGRLAVVSQESSRLWIGRLDTNRWKIQGKGKQYDFPRTGKGNIKYCNIEGVAWLLSDTVVTVSDKRKKKQPERCVKKDQSIHIFKLHNRSLL
ncbi:MAG: hypothetical protein U9Q62_04075 [Campylobacterota bacterium]|nr:hypothetical protein [Campylobacterota bacterium]